MSPRRKMHFLFTMLLMVVGAASELMTIGAVVPFLILVSDVQRIHDVPVFGSLLTLIAAESIQAQIAAAAVLLSAAAIISAAMRVALSWVSLRFSLSLGHEIGTSIFARMLRQPYGYYVTRNSSELIAGLDKVQVVVQGVLVPGLQAVLGLVISLAIVALMFMIDAVTATVAATAVIITYAIISFLVRDRLHRNAETLSQCSNGRIRAVQEGLGGMRDILLENSQQVFEVRFRRLDYGLRLAQAWNSLIQSAPRYAIEAVGIILIAILSFYYSTQPGGVIAAIPVLGAMALGAQRLLPLLQTTYLGWSSAAGNRRMLLEVTELLSAPVVTSAPRKRTDPIHPFQKEVRLDQVSFSYPGRPPSIINASLVIPKGERMGFVGETGSGKSTLVDLLMGLLEPTSGSIYVDDELLCDANRSNWQAQIAHVPQTIYLTDSSIASNIAFGEPHQEIDMEAVIMAAKRSRIHDSIMRLPDGYQTQVGDRGIRLSGGQRQRVGIARALYKRSSVLIFDEATSALDGPTEKAIMETIFSLGDDLTLLIIAHRTSTLKGCDRIVRLASGEIAGVETYEELIRGELVAGQASAPANTRS